MTAQTRQPLDQRRMALLVVGELEQLTLTAKRYIQHVLRYVNTHIQAVGHTR